jgi:hypothetical protein
MCLNGFCECRPRFWGKTWLDGIFEFKLYSWNLFLNLFSNVWGKFFDAEHLIVKDISGDILKKNSTY